MPTRWKRIAVTRDRPLDDALELAATLLPGRSTAGLVHDLAIKGAQAAAAERARDEARVEALVELSTGRGDLVDWGRARPRRRTLARLTEDSRPYDGRSYIAHTSAWTHSSSPAVAEAWAQALRRGQIATCPIVKLELLYSARSGPDFDRLDAMLAALRDVPLTRSVTNAALGAYRELAYRRPLHHRPTKFGDLLIAAAARDAAVGVLHYDHDFDRLAEVLEFESRWIAPPGSLGAS